MSRQSWRRQRDSDLRAKIRRYGYTVVHVGGGCEDPECTEPHSPLSEQFGYTIGLTEHGHPELLVPGLVALDSFRLLNNLGHNIVDHGDRLTPGELIDFGGFGIGAVVEIEDSSQQLIVANEFYRVPYQRPIAALQLVVAGSDRFN